MLRVVVVLAIFSVGVALGGCGHSGYAVRPVSRIAAGYGAGWAVATSGKVYAWGGGAPSPVLISAGGYRDGCVSGDGSFWE